MPRRKRSEEVVVTVEELAESAKSNIDELLSRYNKLQEDESASNCKIADLVKIIDVDGVDRTIAEAFQKINSAAETIDEKHQVSSKALTLASSIPFLGRYVTKAADKAADYKVDNSSVNDEITKLRDSIVKKKEEVISFIVQINEEKEKVLAQLPEYEELAARTKEIIDTASKSSSDYWKALELNTFAMSNITSIHQYIKNEVEPLTISADVISNKIIKILPTLNNQLKRKLSIKAAQDTLKSLNSALGATIELNAKLTKSVTEDVRKTQLEVMEVLNQSGFSATALQDNAKSAIEHTKKLGKAIGKMRQTIIDENEQINKINTDMALEYKDKDKAVLGYQSDK